MCTGSFHTFVKGKGGGARLGLHHPQHDDDDDDGFR
jgi:hypothetical protein